MTIQELLNRVRELTFDKFPIPILYIKKFGSNYLMTLKANEVRITEGTAPYGVKNLLSFTPTTTVADIYDMLLTSDELYSVAQTFGYDENIKTSELFPFKNSLENIVNISAKHWVTEERIKTIFTQYLVHRKLVNTKCTCLSDEDINCFLADAKCYITNHILWYICFYVIEQRRLFEMANSIGDINFSNDMDAFCGLSPYGFSRDYGKIEATMAGMFKVTIPDAQALVTENSNHIGIDNIFGDGGFWWKLQQYYRVLFEREFGDYSLRPDQAITTGQLKIVKDSNTNAHFDSFPYEIYTGRHQFPPTCE